MLRECDEIESVYWVRSFVRNARGLLNANKVAKWSRGRRWESNESCGSTPTSSSQNAASEQYCTSGKLVICPAKWYRNDGSAVSVEEEEYPFACAFPDKNNALHLRHTVQRPSERKEGIDVREYWWLKLLKRDIQRSARRSTSCVFVCPPNKKPPYCSTELWR